MTIHRKRLEGVTATHSLLSLYDECLVSAKTAEPLLTTISTDSSAPPTPQRDSTSTVMGPLLPPLSLDEARSALLEFDKQQWNAETKQPKYLPIVVIRAMEVWMLHNTTNNSSGSNDNDNNKLEKALGQTRTQLHFTPPPSKDAKETPSQRKFRERMEKLRLQNEETNYYKMTSNVSNKTKKDDDITTKSMTYAASVGLNMIVAPISFGVFMFFFSGPILSFVWSNFHIQPGGVDIRKVIIGVISGVAMLFVEMLLFVIRTHEVDRVMTKKQKKKGNSVKPFGEYSSAMERTYKRE